MNYWEKSEGALIQLTFDQNLVGNVSGNEHNFVVSWKEYDFVPNGSLINKTGIVSETYRGIANNTVVLEMDPSTRFNNAAKVVEESSGAVVEFQDGSDNGDVLSLSASIKHLQEFNGYASPWPGGGGKNLIPDGTDTDNGYADNNYIKEDGTYSASNDYYVSEYFRVEPDTIYTYGYTRSETSSVSPVTVGGAIYDSNKTFKSGFKLDGNASVTFTTPSDAYYIRASVRKTQLLMQLEAGGTATEYVPYSNICPFVGFDNIQIVRQRENLVHNLQGAGRATATVYYADINTDGSFTLIHRENSSTGSQMLPLNPTTNYSGSAADTAALYALPDLFVLKTGYSYLIQDCSLSCFTGDVSTRVNLNNYVLPQSYHRSIVFTPDVDYHVKQVRS